MDLHKKMTSLFIMLKSFYLTAKYSVICWRQSYKGTRTDIDTLLRRWSQSLLNAADVSYQVYNPHQVVPSPGHSYIIMSNHASHYDIPLIFMSLQGSIRMIGKKELFRVPVWGHAMKACEILAIDRKNSAQALQDLEVVKEKMRSGVIPWIAPEGTRSRHGKLNIFKKGGFMLALQTGATIIPVGIRGSGRILPPDTWQFNPGQAVEIHIGQPVSATDYTVATRNELIKEVRKRIATASALSDD